jgi:hypothetical protein
MKRITIQNRNEVILYDLPELETTLGDFIILMKKYGWDFAKPFMVKWLGEELEKLIPQDDWGKDVIIRFETDLIGEGPGCYYYYKWEVIGYKIANLPKNKYIKNFENGFEIYFTK